MKSPILVAETKGQQHSLQLNPFAVELLAESFAARRNAWGDNAVCVVGWGKDHQPVYICISSAPPDGVSQTRRAGGGDLVIEVTLRPEPPP